MTPPTPAGQDEWDRLYDTFDFDARYYGDKVIDLIDAHRPAIERQAADRALAELRREVEDPERFSRAEPPVYAMAYNAAVRAVLALIDKASKPEEGA